MCFEAPNVHRRPAANSAQRRQCDSPSGQSGIESSQVFHAKEIALDRPLSHPLHAVRDTNSPLPGSPDTFNPSHTTTPRRNTSDGHPVTIRPSYTE